MHFLLALLLALSAPACLAGAKKRPPLPLSVHAIAPNDLPSPFSLRVPAPTPSGSLYLEKIPVFNQRHLLAVHPIPAADGSFGAYFRLDSHGARAWEAITSSRQATSVAVLLNNRLIATLRLDRPIRDGILYVPSGIQPNEMQLLCRFYPPLLPQSNPAN